ncbi:hypothetical protein ABPG74_000161 [Tetrahymena malaccensis]
MKKIKTLFRALSLSSEYDKILLKIQSSEDYLRPTEDMIIKLKDGLEGHDQELCQQKAIQELFSSIKSYDNWNQAIKMFYIIHKLIHMMKLNVTYIITENDITQNLKANLKIQNQCDEVHVPIIIKYYQFLKLISKNFNEFYQCEQYFQSESLEYLKLKKVQEIINTINPLISILKNVFRVTQNLSFSLQNYSKFEINKYVSYMLIKDSIMIYDFVSDVMTIIKDLILTENQSISLQIYEAYEEIVILTKNIEKIYDLRNLTIDPYIKRPKYFKIDKDNNRQIELHINQIQKRVYNSDNVAATVNKSVNESNFNNQIEEISPIKDQQSNKQSQQNKRGREFMKYQSKDTVLTTCGSYSNRVIYTELENLNQKNKNGSQEETQKLRQSDSPNNAQSYDNINDGSKQFFAKYENPEISENKEDQNQQNLFDDECNENQRIYVNNLCSKNDKIQPVAKKDQRKIFINQIVEQNESQTIQNDIIKSNSVIKIDV